MILFVGSCDGRFYGLSPLDGRRTSVIWGFLMAYKLKRQRAQPVMRSQIGATVPDALAVAAKMVCRGRVRVQCICGWSVSVGLNYDEALLSDWLTIHTQCGHVGMCWE